MEDTTLIIGALATLIAAFGVKEVWNIWKKKIDIHAAKEIRDEENETKGWKAQGKLLTQVIEELKQKIDELEAKIDKLVEENTALKVKIGKMEEQLIDNAAARSRTKRTTKKN
jgi:peptidoglycan hydrolase CwlO-like protein